MSLKDQLNAWQAAGVVDSATAARIAGYEASRPPAVSGREAITAGEVVAYIGTVVLLVGIGFLYGTQYQSLQAAGRLVVLGLVVAAGLAAGELVRRAGASTGAGQRARAAGWSIAAVASAAWFAQLCADNHVLTRPPAHDYQGAPDDISGALMLGAFLGALVAAGLLWRARAGLLAVVAAMLAYIASTGFDVYNNTPSSAWAGETTWLVPAICLGALGEALARDSRSSWAREILRLAAVLPPAVAALAFSSLPGGEAIELFSAVLALGAFGLAYARGSAGYAIGGGVALFIVVNEVGFRHFASSVGFPVVLIASGITLLAVAGGLFRLLPRLQVSRPGLTEQLP